jgi:hypothetical protein
LEHGIEFPFENVASPKKQVARIMQLKDSLMLDDSSLEDSIADNRKFDVLVEAL